MHGGGIDDRPGAVMGRDRQMVGLRQARDLARLGDAADPAEVGHHDADGAAADELAIGKARGQGLAGGDRHAGGARELGQRIGIVHADRIFEPEGIELLQRRHDPLGRGQIPQGVELDHDVHAIADRLADLAEGLQRPVEIGAGDVAALAGRGIIVEGPDLHAGDALLQQARGQLIGMGQEGLEILIGSLGDRALRVPLAGDLIQPASDIAVAGAGVVGADPVVAEAAQQLMDRLAGRLAEEIPERDIDGGEAAHLRAAAAETDIGRAQGVGVLVDPQGILAQKIGRRTLVDIGRDGLGAEEGLAEADQAFVGHHLDPDADWRTRPAGSSRLP